MQGSQGLRSHTVRHKAVYTPIAIANMAAETLSRVSGERTANAMRSSTILRSTLRNYLILSEFSKLTQPKNALLPPSESVVVERAAMLCGTSIEMKITVVALIMIERCRVK